MTRIEIKIKKYFPILRKLINVQLTQSPSSFFLVLQPKLYNLYAFNDCHKTNNYKI